MTTKRNTCEDRVTSKRNTCEDRVTSKRNTCEDRVTSKRNVFSFTAHSLCEVPKRRNFLIYNNNFKVLLKNY